MKCKLITGWSTSSKVILIAHNRWRIHSVCIYSKHCPGIQYWACILCFNYMAVKAVTPGNRMIKFTDDTYIYSFRLQTQTVDSRSWTVLKNGRGRTTLKSTLPSTPRSSSPTKGGKQWSNHQHQCRILKVSSMKILQAWHLPVDYLVQSIFRIL